MGSGTKIAMKNPYDVLGVSKTASQDEIKSAYRKLAKKLHPDLNPGDASTEQRFKEVSQAYGLLSDSDKRAKFDRGEIDASGQETPFGQGAHYRQYAEGDRGTKYYSRSFDFGAEDFSVEDIFADLFGGAHGAARGSGGGRHTRHRGQDLSYTLRVGFLDAAIGATKRVRMGDGKTIDVKIPPGTEDRQTLRLKGQGMPGAGGANAGDAYVEIHIEPHAFFTRKDNDVHVEVPVTLQEAVLGATIRVPTIDGRVSMKIPAGSNTGKTMRLKGRGILDRRSKSRGDQYVKLKVVLPDSPDEDLKRFLEDWGRKHDYYPRTKAGMG
jgi:DnaJ-class molecular chaperone